MNGTYKLILTMSVLRVFQRATMTVGNNSGGVHNIILGAGNDGVGARAIVSDSGNGWICVCCRCLLRLGR